MPLRTTQQRDQDSTCAAQAMQDVRAWIGQLSRRPKILVIDDEQDILNVMTLLLKKYNCDVSLCQNGAKAIPELLANCYDLAFIDLKMSPVDGVTVIKEVRKVKPDFKFIIITGYANDSALAQKIKELGTAVVLSKPILQEDLNLILNSLKL